MFWFKFCSMKWIYMASKHKKVNHAKLISENMDFTAFLVIAVHRSIVEKWIIFNLGTIVYCAPRAKAGFCAFSTLYKAQTPVLARGSHTILSGSGAKVSFRVWNYTKRVWSNWCSVGFNTSILSVIFVS